MTLEQRENNFLEEVKTFDYETQILAEFFNYWSEPNKKGRMRFELEKTWDTKRRLLTWFNNQKKWNGATKMGTSEARIAALKRW